MSSSDVLASGSRPYDPIAPKIFRTHKLSAYLWNLFDPERAHCITLGARQIYLEIYPIRLPLRNLAEMALNRFGPRLDFRYPLRIIETKPEPVFSQPFGNININSWFEYTLNGPIAVERAEFETYRALPLKNSGELPPFTIKLKAKIDNTGLLSLSRTESSKDKRLEELFPNSVFVFDGFAPK